MGDAEDTFTKQEIQAGYVTSGRDVLARQQQIMAQLQNAVGSSGRKRVGGGGPSGTGKASANPVFPPPSYDEPLPRASLKSAQVQQRIRLGGGPTPAVAAAMSSAPISGPSAASIVAGNHNPTPAPPAAHQTLTPLTPLKRSGSAAKPIGLVGSSLDLTPAESLALQKQREEQLAQQQREMSRRQSDGAAAKFPSSPSSSVGSSASKGELKQNGSIGGTQIGAIGAGTIGGASISMGSSLFGGGYSSNIGSASNPLDFGSLGHATGSGALGGQPIQMPSDDTKPGLIGGISLAPTNNPFSLDSLLSGTSTQPAGGDKWGAVRGSAGQTGLFANSSSFGMSSGGIWGGDEPANSQKRSNPAPIGSNRSNGAGSDIGGTSLFGNSNPFGNSSGSSALASMLGIELPTGSGSLRESGLFPGQSNGRHAAVGSLSNSNAVGAIGAKSNNMMPIGAPSSQGITIGSYSNGGNNSDMALLQSLLPGVNITSGAAPQQVGSLQGTQLGGDKWNGSGVLSQQQYSKDEQQRSGNIW